MPLQLNIQFDIVIYSILAGALTGVLFDGYRLIRGHRIPKAIIIIEDILFWLFCGMVVFTFLLYTNYAFLGAYVYIFMGVTVGVYIKFFSPYILKGERVAGRGLARGFRVTGKSIIYPIKLFMSKMGNKNK